MIMIRDEQKYGKTGPDRKIPGTGKKTGRFPIIRFSNFRFSGILGTGSKF